MKADYLIGAALHSSLIIFTSLKLRQRFSLCCMSLAGRHGNSFAARFRSLVERPLKYHIYLSQSHEVAVNLSIEHYLFQRTHPASTVLFLYVNEPCIVLGTNQNPWLEVNHALVRRGAATFHSYPSKDEIKVIRRRSGGGTVFHDRGNLNFSVICQQAGFYRDKYAEMVVRAIRKMNPRARVNNRHDIVLDPGPLLAPPHRPDLDDTHQTPYAAEGYTMTPRKVSGSAYKQSGKRVLHHGTCLLASPNLPNISEYLRSPAKPFLNAKGVESVRSPVANLVEKSQPTPQLDISILQHHIIEEFVQMYNVQVPSPPPSVFSSAGIAKLEDNKESAAGVIDERLVEINDLDLGMRELLSPGYLYGRTPRFTISTHPWEKDNRPRPPLPKWFPPSARVFLEVDKGTITSSRISLSEDADVAVRQESMFHSALWGYRIWELDSFWEVLESRLPPDTEQKEDIRRVSAWLDLMLGKETEYDFL
ncbi:MAG: hypothetical protein Q9181_003715 [Wetmoreana brouardii]